MKLAEMIKEPFLELAWWVEIETKDPHCSYYFGPFSSDLEAEEAQSGWIEDLAQEGAQGITNQIKWCQPSNLTICKDELAESFK
ncbi:MAG: DUF1816 domain-containing protein [Stigonema ocellatum SAG 48.90 = DSM 106950]|nr:DUF1816 domain-containing protein [Stigonema ocellatum SAG 48.90 = DSM 106950]